MALYDYAGTSPIAFLCEGAVLANCSVKQGTAEMGILAGSAEGDMTIGIALSGGATGDWIQVQVYGIAKVVSNGTCAIGQVEITTGGKVTTAGGAASRTIGLCLKAGAVDGDIVPVLLMPSANGPANS